MKNQWLLLTVGGVIACVGIIVRTSISQKAEKDSPTSSAMDQVLLPSEQTQPVGLAFGRLIGFPGADQPSMPQRGSVGGFVQRPPASGIRP